MMASLHATQKVFLSQQFESKARGIFGIPPTYYLSNDELKFYYEILSKAADDKDAHIARTFACSTNPECRCYTCKQQDREDSSLEVSMVS